LIAEKHAESWRWRLRKSPQPSPITYFLHTVSSIGCIFSR
jgi:hypothetical protein